MRGALDGESVLDLIWSAQGSGRARDSDESALRDRLVPKRDFRGAMGLAPGDGRLKWTGFGCGSVTELVGPAGLAAARREGGAAIVAYTADGSGGGCASGSAHGGTARWLGASCRGGHGALPRWEASTDTSAILALRAASFGPPAAAAFAGKNFLRRCLGEPSGVDGADVWYPVGLWYPGGVEARESEGDDGEDSPL